MKWQFKTTKGSEHTLCTIYDSVAGKAVARSVTPENAQLICSAVAHYTNDDELSDEEE